MPLSEHEQKILEEIERRLAADDPRFARQVSLKRPRVQDASRHFRLAVALFVSGLALLVGALALNLANPGIFVPLGLLAFSVMLFSVVLAVTSLRAAGQRKPPGAAAQPWFSRVEERWRKRFERDEDR